MHELAVAQQLVRAVLATAEERGAFAVRTIDVEIGELEGLRIESLEGAFALEAEGTPAEGATLHVTLVPAKIFCPSCREPRPVGHASSPDHRATPAQCRECGSELAVEGGRGLVIRRAAMVLEDS